MTMFDPYSHSRIQELRQEQLARRAQRREALRLDTVLALKHAPIAEIVRRIALRSSARPATETRPAGRPALDS